MNPAVSKSDRGERHSGNFRSLIAWWSERLGEHHVPLRRRTDSIHDLLDHDAVHHDLIKAIVRRVYRENRCGHLDAPVSLAATFTALGSIRCQLISEDSADIDQVDLMDSIGWHTRQYFAWLESLPESRSGASTTDLPCNREFSTG